MFSIVYIVKGNS